MKKILCSGVFDFLHEGHVEFLKDAKAQGDYLMVMVLLDKNVYERKGFFPVNSQEKRAEAVRELGFVDEVIIVDKCLKEKLEFIKSLKPDVIALGYDQEGEIIEKLKEELKGVEFYRSKEFAGGVHSSDFRD